MIITLSPTFMLVVDGVPKHAYSEDWIRNVAHNLGLHFRVKWANDRSTRGVLVKFEGSYQAATDAEHDSFIAGIFRLDPEAYVRTALAVFNTRAEFDARLPLEQARPAARSPPGGLVREGFAVHHLDGDPRNNAVENLRAVKQDKRRK